jgi:hypothetical protein
MLVKIRTKILILLVYSPLFRITRPTTLYSQHCAALIHCNRFLSMKKIPKYSPFVTFGIDADVKAGTGSISERTRRD